MQSLQLLRLLLVPAVAAAAGVFDVTHYGAVGDGKYFPSLFSMTCAPGCVPCHGAPVVGAPSHQLILFDACATHPGAMHYWHPTYTGTPRTLAPAPGVTHDTVAVRAAAAAATVAGGGTLLFPAPKVYLTGAFNVTSHTHVAIPTGAKVLGSTQGEDWPLLVAATVWPQFGHGSDCESGAESCRLMHQALMFSWNAVNVTMGGGGAWDCNSQKETWWACARDLSKAPCSGYGRPRESTPFLRSRSC